MTKEQRNIAYCRKYEKLKDRYNDLEELIPFIVQHAYVLATVEEEKEDQYTLNYNYKISSYKHINRDYPKYSFEIANIELIFKATDNELLYIQNYLDEILMDTREMLEVEDVPYERDGDEPDDGSHIVSEPEGLDFGLAEIEDADEYAELGYDYAVPVRFKMIGNTLTIEFTVKKKEFREANLKKNLAKIKKELDDVRL